MSKKKEGGGKCLGGRGKEEGRNQLSANIDREQNKHGVTFDWQVFISRKRSMALTSPDTATI